jgi:dTDP-4-dehydrorhamnose 3,5-epimerase
VLREFGIGDEFVQDNHSRSRRGVVRGTHFQPGMAKLIRCARGAILDVLVDLRRSSAGFGRWQSSELSDSNHMRSTAPTAFGHGFCVLSQFADVIYKTSADYEPTLKAGFAYDDPAVGIEWPADLDLAVSARDRQAPRLAEIADSLPFP